MSEPGRAAATTIELDARGRELLADATAQLQSGG
jgi:hypothetical protein